MAGTDEDWVAVGRDALSRVNGFSEDFIRWLEHNKSMLRRYMQGPDERTEVIDAYNKGLNGKT